jgi:superfamily II DNA or RNA helicase/diadenosine tetraphosphate (Ap4A) HIT family hydrolase/HKD family nuclease
MIARAHAEIAGQRGKVQPPTPLPSHQASAINVKDSIANPMRLILDGMCPFCLPDTDQIVFAETLLKAIWDGFPVSPGHLLITPHRHVPTWADLHASEQSAIIAAIEKAQAMVADLHGADGFNVGFNEGPAAGQTIPHFHLHIIPRRNGDMADPRGGVRHVIPSKGNYLAAQSAVLPLELPTKSVLGSPHVRALIVGGEDALIGHLLPHIDRSIAVDLAVSFILESGIRLLRPHLQELLDRGGRLRILTGDYLDVTDPDALRRMTDLEGDAALFVFEAGTTGFHPKSWIFHFRDGSGVALVGSSNLSQTALRTGVEWNFRTCTPDQKGDWADVLDGFEALLARPEVKPLSNDWIDAYEARRLKTPQPTTRPVEVALEPALAQPAPHMIQTRALAALQETRAAGFTAGLVVLATGLGKTWLSAFDSNRREFRSVLFVAHREEILSQAMETFRVCRPKARLGRYNGTRKDYDAEVLFASIQTLGRITNLRHFAPDQFDYIVVDEFHHAAAATYRKLIDHFSPKFMIGLTATPDRTDGADLLGLCQENLVFCCDAFEGIETGLLSKFSYFGVPDDVDYSQIPWRSTGFDEQALTLAVATQARAQNAFEQHQKLGGVRTLAFCVSRRHADFMAAYFGGQGLRTASVHSGPGSAPRATSLEALEAGDLDVVFAVDMFNEGVDVPSIDTVLMLRPTESSIVWLQQFGRGLRRSEGKDRLRVIDYIGNHRSFLTKARTLLQCASGDRALALKLDDLLAGRVELPVGCDVTYELEALDIMRGLLRPTAKGDAFEAAYLDFKLQFGVRPTASEMYHAGFNPRATGHGGWFEFVEHLGDLTAHEQAALASHGDFIELVLRTPMTRSFKMLLLRALRLEGSLPGEIEIDRLQKRFVMLASRHPAFRREISVHLDDDRGVRRMLEQHPINAWTGARSRAGKTYFSYDAGRLAVSMPNMSTVQPAFEALIDEIIDWRLAEYLSRSDDYSLDKTDAATFAVAEGAPPVSEHAPVTGPALWRSYMREEIPPLFGLRFSTGSWNQGFVVQGKQVFLLVTLDKADLQADHKYDDGFLSPDQLRWQSQNRTTQASTHGQIISQALSGYQIYLFVRSSKKRGAVASPFTYCGQINFASWQGNAPITVIWNLQASVPNHLWRMLKVPLQALA